MTTIISRDNSAEANYAFGTAHPYDTPTDDERKNSDWADWAARGVIAELRDRRNIKHGFQDVDEETRKEIVQSLAAIIRFAESGKIQRQIQDLAWIFTLYAYHLPECDKFDDLPDDEQDTTERICTCGFDEKMKKWQAEYGPLDDLFGE